eukprot:m.17621 g.17621  ORF g.17621 m.17621 type:complete len:246 (+) comp7173_c0_seq2:926-1663(+)
MSLAPGGRGGGGGMPVFRSSHARGEDGAGQRRRRPVRQRSPKAKRQAIELTARIYVPTRVVGAIIGAGGQTIKQMQTDSGSRIHVKTEEEGNGSREVIVTGSAREVMTGALLLSRVVGERGGAAAASVPCKLSFGDNSVQGKVQTRPEDVDLYNLFESDAGEPVYAVASVSHIDVTIGEAHVDAAIDDAVFLHGGAAGITVDAWIACEPRLLFAWGLSREHTRELLASLDAMLAPQSDEDQQQDQ